MATGGRDRVLIHSEHARGSRRWSRGAGGTAGIGVTGVSRFLAEPTSRRRAWTRREQ